jgi:hypothetical protein
MPYKNRVDPYGRIFATPERGAWFGNRGVLHDRNGELRRRSLEIRWIICELEFKGRRRPLLQPGKFTELFFCDEASAMAAGYRPCMECRRTSAKHFLELAGFSRVSELDEQLSRERGLTPELVGDWRALPDGAFFAYDFDPCVVRGGKAFRWSFGGYSEIEIGDEGGLLQLTPPTTIKVLRRGYPVQIGDLR